MRAEAVDWGSAKDWIAEDIKRDERQRERFKALTMGSFNVKRPTLVVCRSRGQFNEFVAENSLENAICVTREEQLEGLDYRRTEFVLLDPPDWWTHVWHVYVTKDMNK